MNDTIDEKVAELGLNLGELRQAISDEYAAVAKNPKQGFHFHTGRPLSRILGYADEWLEGIPESSIESFAGTGNPFSVGEIKAGERVVDVGCGAGIDSLIAAKKVGPEGKVIGVDMTEAMLDKARRAGNEAGFKQVEFRNGHIEKLPVPDGWADVVLSVSVLEHVQDKTALVESMARALRPGGLCVLTMDLDLRGDFEIGPEAHRELHRTISRRFHPEYPVRSVHPRDMLLSTNGPYGFRLPPPARLLRFRTKQWLRGLVGAARRPIYPFELAVEGLVLRRS